MADLEKAALDLLQAPYTSGHAYAITTLCTLLKHPECYPPGSEPKFNRGGCPCGFRKPRKMEDM